MNPKLNIFNTKKKKKKWNLLKGCKCLAYPNSNVKKYQILTDSSNYAAVATLHKMFNNQQILIVIIFGENNRGSKNIPLSIGNY